MCMNAIGQCGCAGKEMATYYPTAIATSSNSGVALAVYRAGRLSVFGRSAGTAVITLRASLRQFTDTEVTLDVIVEGEAGASDGMVVPPEFLEMPDEALLTGDDRQDLVEKTAMGRPIRFVRIGGDANPEEVLASLVGTDGETTFWYGDTLHQPEYSLLVMAEDCTESDAQKEAGYPADAFALDVTTVPEGVLTQALTGLDSFVGVSFAGDAPLPCKTTIYANAHGVLVEGTPVSLYSYDEAAKSFVEETEPAEVAGAYIKFTVDQKKTYVVSSRDLVVEANTIVDAGTPLAQSEDGAMGSTLPIAIPIAVIVIALGAVIAFVLVRTRKKDQA